jgi:folate-binding protein YgfZ
MNTGWHTFLLNQKAIVEANLGLSEVAGKVGDNSIYPLTHLAALTVSGKDSAKLLQGQITCNINDINESNSSLGAICNPKGRAIATFLLVKKADAYLLVLPFEMLETVKKRLQMFVLRSEVKISDCSDELCLIGVCGLGNKSQAFVAENLQGISFINLPGSMGRKMIIADAENAMRFWSEQVDAKGFRKASSGEWRYLDIVSGIPWVTTATSEEFIPQMLNLDKLGGISFNKGCYTGQEIVARTHYLGKAKREMVLAECQCSTTPEANASIINKGSGEQEIVGKVLLAQQNQQDCKMQLILQLSDKPCANLGLQGDGQTQIKLIPFQA